MHNILFYYFVELSELEQLRQELFKKCEELALLGKILIANEGLNGCLTGNEEECEQFMAFMKEKYEGIDFKVTPAEQHNFKKLFVRIRPEIVTFKEHVDLKNKAQYIQPAELKKELDEGKELVLIDGRNNYESKIGKFKGAVTPDVTIFSDFPKALEELKEYKDKSIVTYCTGGIRCEKLSAYMRENGFKDVRQLHGGIIKYGQEVGNDHWEGSCFVFDDRLAIPIAEPLTPITECEWCSKKCDAYHHCMLPSCDRRFIACKECVEEHRECCSKDCLETKNNTQSVINAIHS